MYEFIIIIIKWIVDYVKYLIENHEECSVEKHEECLIEKHERSHVESIVWLMLCAQSTSNLKHVESLTECLIESSIESSVESLLI